MKLKRLLLVVLLAVLVGPATTLPTAGASEKEPVDLVFDEILAMYQDLEVDKLFELAGEQQDFLKKIDFDPQEAQFYDLADKAYGFSDKEKSVLKNNGFFVRDTGWYGGFGVIYYNIYAKDLPVMVTTDSLLHALHKSYDDILVELEESYFHPAIGRILEATRQEVQAMERANDDPALRKSLVDADLYLTVALSLLSGFQKPCLLADNDKVAEILDNVESLAMLVPMQDPPIKLFGENRWVDFSQFKPRGHYNQSKTLQRYFRTLMWLGRADTGMNVLDSKRQLVTAALLSMALEHGKQTGTLKQMDDIINFMIGRSDNLTVFGLGRLLDEMGVDHVSRLTDREFLKALEDNLKDGRAGSQMIRSQMVLSWPDDTVKASPPSLFQLFGQRYIIDSFVLSKVVYDDIIYKGVKQQRTMPSPLDVMAAFGNREALNLLRDQLAQWNYSANLQATRQFVASHQAGFWQDNLYNIWLDALRTLHHPMDDDNIPQAMRTRSWQHKQLNTQLASWAQLRHDTILYAKQSYSASIGCDYPRGFVEPYPEFYAKLGFFAQRAGTLLGNAEFIDSGKRKHYEQFFGNMEEIMERLETMAEKELAATPFSSSEQKWLETLIRRKDGSGYGATPVYSGWYVDLFYGGQKAAIEWDPTVADVHTDPNSRQVLEVGVGRVDTLFMAVDSEDDVTMYAGPTFSYYQFHQPASDRMTDEQWKQAIQNGKAPARPDWTKSFLP